MIQTSGTLPVSTHSRPKAAGSVASLSICSAVFQHTAARRRLEGGTFFAVGVVKVSTHSRPKAAGKQLGIVVQMVHVSTHSRPKAAVQADI